MKKIKSKIFTLMITLALACSCFLFAPKQMEVHAGDQNDINQTSSMSFNLVDEFAKTDYSFSKNEKTIEYKLYDVDNLSDYYSVNTDNFTWKKSSKSISGNRIYVSVSWGISGNIKTTFNVNTPNIQKAISNGAISIQIKSDLSLQHTGGVKLYNGTNVKTAEGSSPITEKMTMTENSSTIEYHAKGSTANPVSYFMIEVKNPVVVLTTTDISAPVVTLQDISDWEWQNSQYRQVSFDVNDSQSGISAVRVINQNGEDVTASITSSSADTKSKTYTFDAYLGDNYRVVTTDNVNNTATYDLILSDQLKLDTTAGILNINQIDTLHSNKLNVKFNYTSDNKSDEVLYYTLVSETDYNESINAPSETNNHGSFDISLLSDEVVIPFGNIIEMPIDNTNYVLSAIVIDSAGNMSQVSKQTFKYDSRRFAVIVEVDGGDYSLNGCETLEELSEDVPHAWPGTLVDLCYSANDGYEFYKIIRYEIAQKEDGTLSIDENGNYVRLGQGQELAGATISTGYKYTCDDHYIYVIKFRYIVTLSANTTYDYMTDDNGEGVKQDLEYTLNNVVSESGENLITIDNNLIEISYILNDNTVEGIKDAGTYMITWKVVDNDDFVGSGSLNVVVNPKVVSLVYKNYDNLVYNQLSQTILVECDKANLNDVEIEILNLDILYFDANDLELASPMTEMINAGSYVARVTISNSNYVLLNPTQAIEIAKKTVEVTNIVKSTFAYNASKQRIEYELFENIETNVVYVEINDEGGINVGDNFLNAGLYTFEILPIDNINYVLTNNTGNAEITVVNAYFRLNKRTYDYTGIALTIDNLDFDILDGESEDSSKIEVNGLYFDAYDEDGNPTLVCEADKTYKIVFKTDDANYVLYHFEFDDVEVKTTILNIVAKNIYEYTGSNIEFEYIIKNENGGILSEINGISIEIKCGEEVIDINNIQNVASYTYVFTASDPRFVINGSTGNFDIIKAKLTVQVNSLTYTYNQSGYAIDYTVKSESGADYKDKVNFEISQDGEVCVLKNVGRYDFNISFVDDKYVSGMEIDKICDFNGEDIVEKTITISPADIWLEIVREYTYCGEEIDIEYEYQDILDSSEISILHDTILNVGNYICNISSINPNYIIRVENCITTNNITTFEIIVNPYIVHITGAIDRYTYSGSEIQLGLTLSKENLDYTIVAKIDDQETQIIDVGSYMISLNLSDENYKITDSIEIVVEPKPLNIELNINSIYQTYNKDIKAIEYTILDGEDSISVASNVTYYAIDGSEISPINAGNYAWQIVVTDNNYVASLTNSQDNYLVIAKKHATLTVSPNQYKSYGSSDEIIEYTLAGVCPGDIIEINLEREEGESVGRYKINLIDFQSENYELDYVNEYFRISPKKLMIIADKMSKTFGDADPEFTYTIYIDINGNLEHNLIGDDILMGSLERIPGEDVGSYAITLGTLYSPNYNIVFSDDTFVILPKTLDVILQDKIVTYGTSETLTYTIEGEYDSQYITGQPTREVGDTVGEYVISQGSLSSNNYNLNVTNGIYKITKAPLVVKAVESSKIYGQMDNLEYNVYGLIGDDVLEGELEREQGEDVGSYAILQGSLSNPNYEIEFVSSNLKINKANLEIMIDDKSQIYGEAQAKLTCTITGLQYDDEISINLMKTGSDDAGVYNIVADFEIPNNYALTKYDTGTYTIEKATIVPILSPKTFIYSGKEYTMTCDNLNLPLRFVYKQFGRVVDSAINAGTYKVQAYFDGNANYNQAVSNEADLVIEQQLVFFTLTQTEFIYDGSVKYPVYTFDKTIGLTEHQIEFTFENNIEPIEVGEYNFEMKVKDGLNYKGITQGTIKIQNAFVVKDNNGIIECNDATFDENVQQIKLVQNTDTKKFNNEKVLSVCTLENADAVLDSGYVYTVKVKATQGVDSVKVYKVGLSGFSEIAIKVENGYYVFQVDDLNNKYIITTEVKTLSTLAWILILVTVAVAFSITLIVVAKKKHKKAKVSQESKKDIETYNEN